MLLILVVSLIKDTYIFIIERHENYAIKYPNKNNGRTETHEYIIIPIIKTFQQVFNVYFLPLVSAKYPNTKNPHI